MLLYSNKICYVVVCTPDHVYHYVKVTVFVTFNTLENLEPQDSGIHLARVHKNIS